MVRDLLDCSLHFGLGREFAGTGGLAPSPGADHLRASLGNLVPPGRDAQVLSAVPRDVV